MKTSKFTDSQIMSILKQVESGTPVAILCRERAMQVLRVSRTLGKLLIELLNEAGQPGIGFGNRADAFQAHLLDQTVLQGPVGAFHTTFGLW